ncbi:MAG: purine/pyrimidine permease [Rhodospirillaceae bacterium]|jgi:uric acid transporter|nr:purine/pyrimidine permease [Rhodospirillales bacterium]MBT3904780.1 purine/pyrimidine permease [Rhodospirillaceae bacterium]MBT5033543.1 purine/pyrimidine permease [Rhodospirillaceae bacterium]MBT6219444.1 purine/pyrimidine permease [Rhodospirillaceae bacterium]MBT6361014.1 purine/pyrimidine permease [Rhodospirillaceae bacterium]
MADTSEAAEAATEDRGFATLELQLDDYPGPLKTALFGIQHVLVMFTAMVGGPLIVGRLLKLPADTQVDMIAGTMIGCGIGTMISALGVGFIGARLPIVMGVFYIFIGPLVAIGKTAGLAAAMTALIIGGLIQFAWSPLIGKMRRFFPAIVTGTTILLIGTGLMKIGIMVATGFRTPGFGQPLTLSLALLMIVLIVVIASYTKGFVRALSLFAAMVVGYLVAAAFGMLDFSKVAAAPWVAAPNPFPYGGLVWPGLSGLIAIIICFFATSVEVTGDTLAVSRIVGVPSEDWRVRGAVANDGIGSAISAAFGGMALTSYSQNVGVISLTGIGSRFVVAAGGAFLILMALVPKVAATIALIPAPVLGGVLLVMFGMVASVGIDIIGRNIKDRRDALIVAVALGVGLGIQVAPPGAFNVIMPEIRLLTSDGIVMGIMTALVLNIILPKEKEKE